MGRLGLFLVGVVCGVGLSFGVCTLMLPGSVLVGVTVVGTLLTVRLCR